jgi:hypothetical protein
LKKQPNMTIANTLRLCQQDQNEKVRISNILSVQITSKYDWLIQNLKILKPLQSSLMLLSRTTILKLRFPLVLREKVLVFDMENIQLIHIHS